jgi:glycine hydroxymethyltransferase
MELAHIAANKNTVPGDVSAMVPGGIRMGTPALTSRGFTEDDFEKVAEYFDRAVEIAVKVKGATGKGPVIKIGDSCLVSATWIVTMEKFV